MSDDLDAIRALIPAYAGHAGADERRLSDQQVRAFAGELLVDLGDPSRWPRSKRKTGR